jgi:hypothetical protein
VTGPKKASGDDEGLTLGELQNLPDPPNWPAMVEVGQDTFDGYKVAPGPGDVIGAVYTEGDAAMTPLHMPAADAPRVCARCAGAEGGCWRCKYTGVTSPATDGDR